MFDARLGVQCVKCYKKLINLLDLKCNMLIYADSIYKKKMERIGARVESLTFDI